MSSINGRAVNVVAVDGAYTVTVSQQASSTGSAAMSRSLSMIRQATSTGTAVMSRLVSMTRQATSTAAAAMSRTVSKTFQAAASSSASMLRTISKTFQALSSGMGLIAMNPLLFAEHYFGARLIAVGYPNRTLRIAADDRTIIVPRDSADQPQQNDREIL